MRSAAVEFSGPGRVALIEVEVPPVAVGEARVAALYSGISGGTETLAFRGEIDPSLPLDETLPALRGTFSFPFRYGYSVVGVVEESECDLEVGRTVFCFHPHQARLVAPCDQLIPLDGIEPRIATMLPLVETALQISLDAGARADEAVVVVGLGAVGILAGAMLARGGARVLGSDPKPWRREAASFFGFEAVAPEDVAERAATLSGRRGVPLVVEASGDPAAAADALDLLAHEGTLLVASWYGTRLVPLPLGDAFHRRRLVIRSTQVSTIPSNLAPRWTFERRRAVALELLSELPLKRLATHEFDVTRAGEAFDAVARGEEGLIHAAISYGDR